MTFRAEQASGMALEALGREDEALAHYERMLTVATELDQQLPRTGNSRWTSEAHGRLGAYFMAKGKWEQSREHYDHLLRDPYLLTNTASEDLSRLDFTGSALWSRAYYYRFGVSNRNMALDYFRQSLSFSEAHLKRANSDQTAEFGAGLTIVHIGMVLCEQRNYAEGLPLMDEALHRMESLASRDKANWNFQDVLAEILRAHAKWRAAAARAGEFSSAECLSFLEQARTSYQRCLEMMNASAANSRQKSWVDQGVDDVKRGLKEVEAAIATLKEK
jgi:tetratricopeptide (TPR) repeat protein